MTKCTNPKDQNKRSCRLSQTKTSSVAEYTLKQNNDNIPDDQISCLIKHRTKLLGRTTVLKPLIGKFNGYHFRRKEDKKCRVIGTKSRVRGENRKKKYNSSYFVFPIPRPEKTRGSESNIPFAPPFSQACRKATYKVNISLSLTITKFGRKIYILEIS